MIDSIPEILYGLDAGDVTSSLLLIGPGAGLLACGDERPLVISSSMFAQARFAFRISLARAAKALTNSAAIRSCSSGSGIGISVLATSSSGMAG